MALGVGSERIPPVGDWPAVITAALAHIPLWGFMLAFILLPALGFPILTFRLKPIRTSVGTIAD